MQLTMSISMVRLAARTDSMRQPTPRLLGLAEDAGGGADDEVDGGWGEGVVAESGVVEFAEDELAHGVGLIALPKMSRARASY
jgi:hypothetical protein